MPTMPCSLVLRLRCRRAGGINNGILWRTMRTLSPSAKACFDEPRIDLPSIPYSSNKSHLTTHVSCPWRILARCTTLNFGRHMSLRATCDNGQVEAARPAFPCPGRDQYHGPRHLGGDHHCHPSHGRIMHSTLHSMSGTFSSLSVLNLVLGCIYTTSPAAIRTLPFHSFVDVNPGGLFLPSKKTGTEETIDSRLALSRILSQFIFLWIVAHIFESSRADEQLYNHFLKRKYRDPFLGILNFRFVPRSSFSRNNTF